MGIFLLFLVSPQITPDSLANKVTQVRADHARKTNHMTERWGFKPFDTSQTCGEGMGPEIELSLMANDSINHAYIMKPQ